MNDTELSTVVDGMAAAVAMMRSEIPKLRAEVQAQIDWERSYTKRVEALEVRITDLHKATKQLIEDVTRLAYHVGMDGNGGDQKEERCNTQSP